MFRLIFLSYLLSLKNAYCFFKKRTEKQKTKIDQHMQIWEL